MLLKRLINSFRLVVFKLKQTVWFPALRWTSWKVKVCWFISSAFGEVQDSTVAILNTQSNTCTQSELTFCSVMCIQCRDAWNVMHRYYIRVESCKFPLTWRVAEENTLFICAEVISKEHKECPTPKTVARYRRSHILFHTYALASQHGSPTLENSNRFLNGFPLVCIRIKWGRLSEGLYFINSSIH